MASPKSKISRSKRGMRRSHAALWHTWPASCPHCKSVMLPHRVCPHCGHYKGKPVLQMS